jgi:hypothetical protein
MHICIYMYNICNLRLREMHAYQVTHALYLQCGGRMFSGEIPQSENFMSIQADMCIVYISMYTCIHIYTNACAQACVYAHAHTHTWHTYIHTMVCIYEGTRTHIWSLVCWLFHARMSGTLPLSHWEWPCSTNTICFRTSELSCHWEFSQSETKSTWPNSISWSEFESIWVYQDTCSWKLALSLP